MSSAQKDSEPLKDFTDRQIADLAKSINALEEEEKRIVQEDIEEKKRKASESRPFRRLRKSPLEILNRILFFVFIISFLVSFFWIYAVNRWWFFWYLISAFSCILYTPNRKALKELLDAWPNINDLITGNSKQMK